MIQHLSNADRTLEAGLLQSAAHERPRTLVRNLRATFPEALAYACALGEGAERRVFVTDASGELLVELQKRLLSSEIVESMTEWERALAEVGTPVVAFEGDVVLAVVLPCGGLPEAESELLEALRQAAQSCALTLLRSRAAELEEEVRSLEALANAGEVSGVVAHEFSNFLNTVLLQVAVMEVDASDALLEELAILRRQGHHATNILDRFQEYRQGRNTGARTDLAEVVGKVVRRLETMPADSLPPLAIGDGPGNLLPDTVSLRHELSASIPVSGRPLDVYRLAWFLVINSIRLAARAGRRVVVAVESRPTGGVLRIDSSASALWQLDTSTLFDSSVAGPSGVEKLELAACRALARRLRCELRIETVADSRFRLLVLFPSPNSH